jgi:tetratricopeptide (TPR) repeat protein
MELDKSVFGDAAIEVWLRSRPFFDRTNWEEWRRLAWQAIDARQVAAAIACFREVTRLAPDFVEAWLNLGALSSRRGEHLAAVDYYREGCAKEPKNWAARMALVRALRAAGDRVGAVVECRAALAFGYDELSFFTQVGNQLQELDQYDEAIECLQRAIDGAGRAPYHVSNLGIALFRRGDIEASIQHFREAIEIAPRYADAHFYLGMALLLMGDHATGWQEYEWRQGGRFHLQTRQPLPIWNGEPLDGKTLLLAAEQGFGDAIQFVRFARAIKERYDCTTLLYCQPALAPLLQTVAGIDWFVLRDEPIPRADFFVPLLSIPSVIGFDPEHAAAPRAYLAAEPARIELWRQRIKDIDGGRRLRVGLSWQGDPKFPADACRSIPPAVLEPLLALEHVRFFSLQKGPGASQLAQTPFGSRVIDFGDELDSGGGAFLDTAAIMQSLDFVITSDTAVAHLGGALGAPTWIALAHVPDWRWQLGRTDSPWYPSAQLFRQPRHGDWQGVVNQLLRTLEQDAKS